MATIDEYIVIEKRIESRDATAETDNLRDRWEFGRLMLAERQPATGRGRPGLPKARMDELVSATGLGSRELGYRMQFAERYPTEDNFCTALQKFPSWSQVKNSLVKPSKRKPAPKPHDRHNEVIALHEDGMSMQQIAEATGIGQRQVRHIIEREHIEEAAKQELDVTLIDWRTVPATVANKLEAYKRHYRRQVEAEFEPRVQATVKVRMADAERHMDKLSKEYRAVLKARKGIFTKAEHDLIRGCLHPDSRASATDAKLAEAFRVFNERDILLLNEADRPTTTFDLADLVKRRTARRR